MARQIPGEFRFMSQQWQIKPGTAKDITTDLGQCNLDERTIYLSPNYPEEVVLDTLFHEIFHAFELVLNQHLTEDQVDNMSRAMTHFFRENPEFMNLLIDEEMADALPEEE